MKTIIHNFSYELYTVYITLKEKTAEERGNKKKKKEKRQKQHHFLAVYFMKVRTSTVLL